MLDKNLPGVYLLLICFIAYRIAYVMLGTITCIRLGSLWTLIINPWSTRPTV